MNILITPSLLEAIEAAKAAGGYRSRNDAIASFLTDYLGSKGFIK
jgi:metal-responsive CopG/Arc/MetJ family transcriptional regulator